MLRIRQLASVAVFALCTLLAQSAVAAAPVIASTSVSLLPVPRVTIKGINFAPGAATVILAGTSLSIVSQSATQIVANLPAGLSPGTYILLVQIGNKANNADGIAFTFGAVGPAGPKGDTGATGVSGTGLRVLDALNQQVGFNFDGESVLVLIGGYPVPVKLFVQSSGFLDNSIDLFYTTPTPPAPPCSGTPLYPQVSEPLVLQANRSGDVAVFGGNIYLPAAAAAAYSTVTLTHTRDRDSATCVELPPGFDFDVAPMTVIPVSSLGFGTPFKALP